MTSMREYYDNYWELGGAGGYATRNLRKWTLKRQTELITALKPLSRGSIILDAGCGIGEFSNLMATSGYRVIGIDLAHKPLVQAVHQRHSNVLGFSVASVEGGLPFAAGTFDAIWSTEVIEHLINVQSTFAEFQRVLKPNGLLILTTPFHGIVKNILLSVRGFERHYDPTGPHIRFYTKRSIKMLLSQTGFGLISSKGIGRFYPLFMSHFVVARKISIVP